MEFYSSTNSPSNNASYSRGDHYEQLFQLYPQWQTLYPFEFEREYHPEPVLDWMKANNYIVPSVAVAIYLLFCVFGQRWMRNRPAFQLTSALALWNLLLATFSLYGAVRTVPHLLHRIATESFEDTVCRSAHVSYGAGAVGLATTLFILSKIPELFDTVFIVLRKKELIFLHWYHHVTVLVFCWNSYVTESAAGLYFVAMNYTVHAVMYFYYFLQTSRLLPRWFRGWWVTTLQIAQMVIGTAVVAATLFFRRYGTKVYQYHLSSYVGCGNSESNLLMGFVIYSSYLYLFVEFAIKRFCCPGSHKTSPSKKATDTKSE